MSLVLADQAERALDAVDLVQTGLLEDGVRTPDDLRRRMAGRAVTDSAATRLFPGQPAHYAKGWLR